MEVRYQLRYSPVSRIHLSSQTADSIPAASTCSHQRGRVPLDLDGSTVQIGPYTVRSSTMGTITVSVRAGCATGPVNSTL
jgi:hypothetical protein